MKGRLSLDRFVYRSNLFFSLLACLLPIASGWPAGADVRQVKILVDAPGVYAVEADEVGELLAKESELGPLRLTHHGVALPSWHAVRREGEGRLVFLVATSHFDQARHRDGVQTIALLLSEAEPGGDDARATSAAVSPWAPAVADASDLPETSARVERVRRFERDLTRAPLDRTAAAAGVESLWYWKMITHQASSQLDVDLGELRDRAEDGGAMTIGVRWLGWSDPRLEGVPDHVVDVRLNDKQIGTVAWDGRRIHEAKLSVPDRGADREPPGPVQHRLRLKIPRRERGGEGRDASETLIDLVYVDRLEIRYPADRHLADPEAPLLLGRSDRRRWLPAPHASDDAVALSSDGKVWARDPRGGWVVPASRGEEDGDGESELWIVEPSHLRAPLSVEPTRPGARSLPIGLDYLMLAPPSLLPGAERLAAMHRRRGLRVAVTDVVAIYDAFGDGEKSPRAIRGFLDEQLRSSPGLRYVLLVGDADWLIADRSAERGREGRDHVPTFVEPSSYGPAASDHFYAADPDDEAVPRFAVGRLPVADASELDALVDKILGHVATSPNDVRSLLMLSDATAGSLRRREKLSERIEDSGFVLRRPAEDPGSAPDEAVIEAFGARPSVVYFGGHGGRFQWQLGESAVAGPSAHFDRDDIARLAPARRWPVALSISCGTAPFDHPSADSLGEALVLAPERGAIAFLGAGVRLFTPRAFSEELIRALAREATLGEAVVAAKRAADREHVSRLYNLLGDPALPLR